MTIQSPHVGLLHITLLGVSFTTLFVRVLYCISFKALPASPQCNNNGAMVAPSPSAFCCSCHCQPSSCWCCCCLPPFLSELCLSMSTENKFSHYKTHQNQVLSILLLQQHEERRPPRTAAAAAVATSVLRLMAHGLNTWPYYRDSLQLLLLVWSGSFILGLFLRNVVYLKPVGVPQLLLLLLSVHAYYYTLRSLQLNIQDPVAGRYNKLIETGCLGRSLVDGWWNKLKMASPKMGKIHFDKPK